MQLFVHRVGASACVYAAYVWSYPSHRPCILLVVGGNDVVSDDILPGRNEFHITLTHESRGHARPAHAHDRLCVCVYGWVRVFIRWNIVRCCWYAVDLMRQHFRHVAASVFGASACSLSRDRAAAAHSTANQRLQVVNWGTNCIWIAVAVVVVVCMLRCGCIQSACVHALHARRHNRWNMEMLARSSRKNIVTMHHNPRIFAIPLECVSIFRCLRHYAIYSGFATKTLVRTETRICGLASVWIHFNRLRWMFYW